MSFQSSVFFQQGFGVPGEMFADAPHKAESFTIVSGSAANNIFGHCFTITSQSIAQAGSGGTLGFAGFLVNPKGSTLFGTSGSPLSPSLTLPNNAPGELLTMGTIIVSLPAAAAIGDLVVFDNTTGALSTISPGANLPTGTTFANAIVDYYTVTAAGLAVISVDPTYIVPVLA